MAEPFNPATPSREWEAMAPYWSTVGDLLAGAEAVRAGGEKYLPRLPEEDPPAYEYRRKTAKYTNILADIVSSLAAKPFRKEVVVKGSASASVMAFAEDVDGSGNSLHVFSSQAFFNGLAYAVDWIYVDYPNTGGSPRTLADERRLGLRPYWVRIPASRMLDVRTASIGGREEFIHVRFMETYVRREGFKEVRIDRVRVVERPLLPDGTYGEPHWQVYEKGAARSSGWELVDHGIMTIGVIPLVPFTTGQRLGGWRFAPPLQGAVDLQVEHYQQEAELKAIKQMVAFPMLAGVGVQPELDAGGSPKPIRVGPRSVLYAPPQGEGIAAGKWEFVEPQGNSLTFLAEQIKATEAQLRELGRQPLTAQTGNLTVVATAFAANKANSVISAWALNLKDALERAFQLTCLWLGDASQPEVEIEDDFDIDLTGENGPETLLSMRKAGDLSQETLWAEMKRRRILSPEFDATAEGRRLIGESPDSDSEEEIDAAGVIPFPNREAERSRT